MALQFNFERERRLFKFFLGGIGKRFDRFLSDFLPKGLYARALIIIIAPIVLLQPVLVFVFMERHWEMVTKRLSTATTQDISMLVSLYESSDRSKSIKRRLISQSRTHFGLNVAFLPLQELPPEKPRPFIGLLDHTLSRELARRITYPFWLDTVGRSKHVEIRIKLDDSILRVIAARNQTHASNSHIFLVWMFGTSIVLVTVAILFMRNQIRPIVVLAEAAKLFGMGRPAPPNFKISGAREVREASEAFLDMRNRIERHVEQRTTMLAGVSHDLRTILTRFKFQLAMLPSSPETDAMNSDIQEMQHMLEDYLAFTKGDNGEASALVDAVELINEIYNDAEVLNKNITIDTPRSQLIMQLRRNGFKRALFNLITNAARFANHIEINLRANDKWVLIQVEDDGPGIPEDKWEDVFRPFYRIDHARNQDIGNTGLGLSIARDIVRAHGGDITLGDSSKLGGLKVSVRVPV